MTSALNAAVYIPLIPVCAAIGSRLLGWERLWRRQYAGSALSIAGALIVTVGQYDGAQSSASAGRALLGNALLLVWMVTAANAIVGRASRDMPLLIDPFAIGEWLDEQAPLHALAPACCEEGYFLKPSDERWSTGASLDE